MHSESDRLLFGVLENARVWAEECMELGWLRARNVERLNRVDHRTPASLFRDPKQRPLVVAFFGGTGVGKSTLLNRLAGHEIARTGVVRPTSHEVSLYLHRSFDLAHLPENFPLEKVRTEHHGSDEMKHVVWIDMPDIDSTESENRQIVLDWLPHLDILIYVVSPERYRDESGWRLLLSEGARHAWLFVMNQYDHGDAAQLDAFSGQLAGAGFENPIVFATDCSSMKADAHDDFDQLKQTIGSLANRHTIAQLEHRNLVSHVKEIEYQIDLCCEAMGNPSAIETVMNKWETIWQDAVNDLEEGIQWPIQEAARSMGSAGGGKKLVKRLAREAQAESRPENSPSTNPVLWDEWAQTRFEDAVDQLLVTAGANDVPVTPFKENLTELRSKAGKILHGQTEQSLRRTLANPGTAVQRIFLNVARICSGLFPLSAIAWVAYEVLMQFHSSSTSGVPYLGLNFAIHSGLLIFVAWLLPWFVYKKLKPSTEEIAMYALQTGARIGYECIKSRIEESLGSTLDQRSRLIDAGNEIKIECRSLAIAEFEAGPEPADETLSRMLSKRTTDSIA